MIKNLYDKIRFFLCSSRAKPTDEAKANVNIEARNIVDELVKLDYLAWVEEAKVESVKQELYEAIVRGYLFTSCDDSGVYAGQRLYGTDAEDLSEGVAFAVKKMIPTLNRIGVKINSVEDVRKGSRILLMLNGDEYLIYDWPNQKPEDLDTWGLGHKRLVEIVSELLGKAKVPERIYGIGWGNDASIIFLRDEMYSLLQSHSSMFDECYFPKLSHQMTLEHE